MIDHGTVAGLEALGVWAAVLVALFGEPARRWFMRPQLGIRLTPERQSFHKTSAIPDEPGEPLVVLVNNPGTWDADEERMLSHGVKVENVVHLKKWSEYGKVRGLLPPAP